MVTGFDRRIDAMEGLTDEERADFKTRNLTTVTEHFIPAYELLLQGLAELKGSCSNEQGLSYDPQGKAYYEYLVRASTGTTYATMDELQKAIEAQIDSDLLEIARVLKEKPEVSQELIQYEFSQTEPEAILESLKAETQKDFPEVVPYSYVTKYVPEELEQSLSPAFFWFLLWIYMISVSSISIPEALLELRLYLLPWLMKVSPVICIRMCTFCLTVIPISERFSPF